jgi:hypothetical protein
VKPQTRRVANHLLKYGSITPRQAEALGTTRLAARIYELKHDNGFDITRKMVKVRTRDGHTRIAEYRL